MEASSVFEKHRAKKAAEKYEAALASWKGERDGYAELLEMAQSFNGDGSSEIMLGAGERLFCKVSGTALVEERRGPTQWRGGSHGVSFPIGSVGGRSIRYRVGATRGHIVQGAPTPTAIDTGAVYITNKRVVFEGGNQTRECLFAKLIGFQHDDADGATTFSVSNRQKPTTVHYGPQLSGWFDFRLDLALAHARGTVGDLIGQLQQGLAQIDAERPAAPAGLPG
jgi:hypothetical protein